MKQFGIVLIFLSIGLLFGGLAVWAEASRSGKLDVAELERLREKMESCEDQEGVGIIARKCDYDRAMFREKLSEMAEQQTSGIVWGYIMMGAFPLFLIIGTVLFAAGKVEETILLSRSSNEAEAKAR